MPSWGMMEVTRYYLGEMGLVAILSGLTILFERPLLLLAAAAIGGWALVRQFEFLRAVATVESSITVSQTLESGRVTTGDTLRLVLEIRTEDNVPLELEVEPNVPFGIGLEETDRTLRLEPADDRSRMTFDLSCPMAGDFAFDSPTVTATGRSGRFRVAFATGDATELVVDPLESRDARVAGDPQSPDAPYGHDSTGQSKTGHELAELRPYVPGDSVKRIDWNATARFDDMYVRQYDTLQQRTTAIVFDCRASMAAGDRGETKFEHLRQVALAIARRARKHDEHVFLYAVGDDGLLTCLDDQTEVNAKAVEQRLRSLTPDLSLLDYPELNYSPTEARELANRLDGDSAFETRLRPFFEDSDAYVERLESDPLYTVVDDHLDRASGQFETVLLTDDRNPVETHNVAKLANQYSDSVLAFVTPSMPFERGTDTSDDDRSEYTDFEQLRRHLVRFDGVSVYDVRPDISIEEVLADSLGHGREVVR